MKRKLMSFIISMVVCLMAMPMNIFTYAVVDEYSGFEGSGTASDPYKIESAYHLGHLRELLQKEDSSISEKYAKAYYIQTKNIDLKNTKFEPIGVCPGTGFSGHYNGGYYTISNLNVDENRNYVGLFGWISGGTIENLIVIGNVNTTTSAKYSIAGGISGDLSDNGKIINCAFIGNVTSTSSNVGGITGQICRGASIENCYAIGDFTGIDSVAGIVGNISEQKGVNTYNIKNCYTVGSVIAKNGSSAAIVGGHSSKVEETTYNIKNNYYLAPMSDNACIDTPCTDCVGLSKASLKEAADLLGTPFVNNNDSSLNNGYPVFEWQTTPYQFKGSGTKDDPYQISSKKELEIMRNMINSLYYKDSYHSKYYIQTVDIDLSNDNWIPIGTRYTTADNTNGSFKGYYNGNNHRITGLYVYKTEGRFAGLFGSLNSGGVIENLEVHGNVNSTGNTVGGIVGELCAGNGIIRNCCFYGDVEGTSNVGGIVGNLYESGTVENCYHNGNVIVTSETGCGGGIAGQVGVGNKNEGTATIKNCYNVGKVVGPSGKIGAIAGLCGINTITTSVINIKNCYYIKDDMSVGTNGKYTTAEITDLSASLMKKVADDLGTPFVTSNNESINNGYPIFDWQQLEAGAGDINGDGKVNVADMVILQKWLLGSTNTLPNWQNADLCKDGRIDVFDMVMMRRLIIRIGITDGIPTSITLNKTSATLSLEGTGNSVQLTATVLPNNATDKTVLWTSSNTNVATVTNDGLVKAVGSGSATITAKTKSGGKTAVCKITVEQPSIKLSKTSESLYIGGTSTLTASVVPSGASVTWSSSDTKIATVSGGKITAVAEGKATITAKITVNGKDITATCAVTVSSASIKLNKTSTSLYIAGSETLTATVVPSGSSVTWSSSNTNVATVSGGKITAVAAGTATITAKITVNGKAYSATCAVTVSTPSIKLNKSGSTLYVAGSETLTATVVPSGSSVSWSSSNTNVATVSGGKITAVAAGSATITAKITVNGKDYTATCTVTVKKPSISLSKTSLSMYIGDSSTISATVDPSGSSVTWSSSNTGVATVSGGKITAVAAGSATITAKITVNGKDYTATCAVTVNTPKVTLSKTSDSSSDDHVYYSSSTKGFYAGIFNLPTATATPSGTVSWSVTSGNATISGGKLFINQPGKVVARASITYQGKTYYADYTYTRTVTFYAGSAFTLRSSASTSSSSLGSIPKGTSLTVSALDYSDSKYVWGKVTYSGKTGYVALWLKDRSESNGIITV